MKKQLPTQTSLAALWGATLAVMLLFGMEVVHPGANVALAQTSAEVAAVSAEVLDTQLAATGAALVEYTSEVAQAASPAPSASASAPLSYSPFDFEQVEDFYRYSEVPNALELLTGS